MPNTRTNVQPQQPVQPEEVDLEGLFPGSAEAEQSVLGSMLLDPDAIFTIDLEPRDFYYERHSTIFTALQRVSERGSVDMLTVTSDLEAHNLLGQVGGSAYLVQLLMHVPSAAHVQDYAALVKKAAVQRALLYASTQIAGLATNANGQSPDELLGSAYNALRSVQVGKEAEVVPIASAVSDVEPKIEAYLTAHKDVWGLPTGLTDLDKSMGGLQVGDLVVIAGDPGTGKSALLGTMLKNVSKKGQPVVLYSLEMTAEQYLLRYFGDESNLDTRSIKQGILTPTESGELKLAMRRVAGLPFYICTRPVSTSTIRSHMMRLKHTGVKVVGVDYSLLLTDRGESEVLRVAGISLSLKRLAKEMGVTVILVHPLTRGPSQQERKPRLSDLGWSRQTEYDPSVILFIYKQENQSDERLMGLMLAKNREGVADIEFTMYFDRAKARWASLEIKNPEEDLPF